jgi:hypothetical protein
MRARPASEALPPALAPSAESGASNACRTHAQ